MIRIIVRVISLGIFILLLPKYTFGQFTYVGGGVDYNFTSYYSGLSFSGDRTANSNMGISGEILFRPVNFLAVGGSYTHIFMQKSSFTFYDSPSSGGYSYTSFNGFSPIQYEGRYATQTFDYNFEHTHRVAVHIKAFPSPNLGLYAEAGLVFTQIDESFNIQRAGKTASYYSAGSLRYGAVPALNYQFNQKYKISTPKFGIGWLLHTKRNIYFDFSMHVIFTRFPDSTFDLQVPYEWSSSDNEHGFVTLRGQATGMQRSLNLSVKTGYFF